ncbi:MAG TPA: hypothetical protein PKC60_12695 [Hydrogenophaga sp.]|uniref:hypothetical protein n=1 Tax=Hydrogenophaga sp. TaxID=1904254 RepID=UPI002BF7C796|nr:hypothetical protein [Hydrogenophaga sp.]HMN94080.1 hypothetical protein [Hydrogenophaga sp.]HMP09894.1 hypothetical protein [Hydrogenophaga sp.]
MPTAAFPSPAVLALSLLLSFVVPGQAGTGSPSPVPEWTLSPDGAHIVMTKARQLWPRCVEGLRWNGSGCAGTPLWMTHAQALEHARRRSQTDGMPWRLPSARELQLLSQQTQGTAMLPDTTLGWSWSGTRSVVRHEVNPYSYDTLQRWTTTVGGQRLDLQHGWAVNTATAQMRSDIPRETPMLVRLVRAVERAD